MSAESVTGERQSKERAFKPDSTQRNISQKLLSIWRGQVEELQADAATIIGQRDLFDAYDASSALQAAYARAINAVAAGEGIKQFEDDVSQGLVQLYLQSTLQEGSVVLSPERTAEVLARLHTKPHDGFPHAIVLREVRQRDIRISGFVSVGVTSERDFQADYHHFDKARAIHPGVLGGGARFMPVVTESSGAPNIERNTFYHDLRVVTVPFDKERVQGHVDHLVRDYAPSEDHATLQTICWVAEGRPMAEIRYGVYAGSMRNTKVAAA